MILIQGQSEALCAAQSVLMLMCLHPGCQCVVLYPRLDSAECDTAETQ